MSLPEDPTARIDLNANALTIPKFGDNDSTSDPSCPMPYDFVSKIITFMSEQVQEAGLKLDPSLNEYKNATATKAIRIMLNDYAENLSEMATDIYSKFYAVDEHLNFTCSFVDDYTGGVRRLLFDDLRTCNKSLKSEKNASCNLLPKAVPRGPRKRSALAYMNISINKEAAEEMIDFSALQKAIFQANEFCSHKCVKAEEDLKACIDASQCNKGTNKIGWIELRQLSLMHMFLKIEVIIQYYIKAHLQRVEAIVGGGAGKTASLLLSILLLIGGIVCTVFSGGACAPLLVIGVIIMTLSFLAGGGDGSLANEKLQEWLNKYPGQKYLAGGVIENMILTLKEVKDENIDLIALILTYLSDRIKMTDDDCRQYYSNMKNGEKGAGRLIAKWILGAFARIFCKKTPRTYEQMIKVLAGKMDDTYLASKSSMIETLESMQIAKAKGGKSKKKRKGPTYTRTTRKHTNARGVTRIVYTKGGHDFVRVKNKNTNTFYFRKIN